MNRRPIADQSGFTLTELLVAVVVMGLVFLTAASLLGFGVQTYVLGETQSWLNMNLGAAAQIITRRVRNSTDLEILGASPVAFDSGWWYLYVENPAADVSKVVLRSANGSTSAITDEVVTDGGLSFATRQSGAEIVLDIAIAAVYRSRDRQVATSTILGNVARLPATTSGPAIRFKIPN